MKIRQRLAIQFMLASGLVTLSILLFIYLITQGFVQSDFIERLHQRANLEILHFAQPNLEDLNTKEAIRLQDPKMAILAEDGKIHFKEGDYNVSSSWIKQVDRFGQFVGHHIDFTTFGRRFELNNKTFYVFISAQDHAGERELNLLIKAMVVGWLVGLLLSYAAGLYFSRKALEPVRDVTNQVNEIDEATLGHRLKVDKDESNWDEIDVLRNTFNGLLARIEKAFSVQRRFVQNASHELKTPLTAIIAEVELALAKSRNESEYRHTLQTVIEEGERLAKITHGLLLLTRLEESTYPVHLLGTVDMVPLVHACIDSFEQVYEKRVSFEHNDEVCIVLGDEQLLRIAIGNILDNAGKYSSKPIDIWLHTIGNSVVLSVKDHGIGIPSDDLERIKVPLFRATNVGTIPGTGLGLALAERIMMAHNGRIEFNSQLNGGSTFRLIIPLRDQWN